MARCGRRRWCCDAGPCTRPEHTSNHLLVFSLDADRALVTGDHVMGWSTTVVSPPDGDMRAYMDSLAQGQRTPRRDPVADARQPGDRCGPVLDAYLAHRIEREQQVLAQVRDGLTTIEAMVAVLYADVREDLHKAAAAACSHICSSSSTTAWWPSTAPRPSSQRSRLFEAHQVGRRRLAISSDPAPSSSARPANTEVEPTSLRSWAG